MTTNPGDTPAPASEFFDEIAHQYDDAIYRCVPRYDEMLDQMLDYVPLGRPERVLELGCGSGNLTRKIIDLFQHAEVVAVDASAEMIRSSQNRFSDQSQIRFLHDTFQSLQFELDSFDLVVSSISIHHLTDAEKLQLFEQINGWLTPNGIFTFCDQFSGESRESYAKHIENWKTASMALGASIEEWNDWMRHQQAHDYHSSLTTHFDLLKNAGFGKVDCTRRHFLWTTLIAQTAAE